MGGYGSGGWNATGRPTTADKLALDVNALLHGGALIPGASFNYTWSRDGEPFANICAGADADGLTLAYTRDGAPHRDRAPLEWMSAKNAGFDHLFKKIICAEPYKKYKPSFKAYDIGVSEIGLPKEQIGFVSSNSFDVIGGANYGYPVFWLDRKGAPLDELGPQPVWKGKDLEELATALGT